MAKVGENGKANKKNNPYEGKEPFTYLTFGAGVNGEPEVRPLSLKEFTTLFKAGHGALSVLWNNDNWLYFNICRLFDVLDNAILGLPRKRNSRSIQINTLPVSKEEIVVGDKSCFVHIENVFETNEEFNDYVKKEAERIYGSGVYTFA